MPSILIVEDEGATGHALRGILQKNQFEAVLCKSGEEALEKLKAWIPDLAILDIGLPGISGIELCGLLKKGERTASIPIIMLTTRREVPDKVEGLDTGADDYVTKPFSQKELLARVNALLRRTQRQGIGPKTLASARIVVNLESHKVTVGGAPIELRPKEFELLALLLGRKGRILSQAFIAESIWGDKDIDASRDVKWWVHQLRKKLGDEGERIETVTNMGYRFSE